MYFQEDNNYNNICEKSFMQWLDELEKHEDIAVRGGVKLAKSYVEQLNRKISNLQEQGKLKDEYLKKMKQKLNEKKKIQVVAAIIRGTGSNEGKIFATQRGYGDFKDGWEFPGGKIEAGETPEEALKREIKEELDTEIKVGDLVDKIEYDYPNFHLSMQCFWCEIEKGDLQLLEHETARWLAKDELDSVNWLPADIELITKLKKGTLD